MISEYFFVYTGKGLTEFLLIWLVLTVCGLAISWRLAKVSFGIVVVVAAVALVAADYVAFLCCGW